MHILGANLLQMRGMYAGYSKGRSVLRGIDLTINAGEVVAVFGKNGSGKTTLAKAMVQMLPDCQGELFFDGRRMRGFSHDRTPHRDIGFFMQGGRVFPHLTISENLRVAARALTRSHAANRQQELIELAKRHGFGGLERLNSLSTVLSGGERHALALLMVLMTPKKLLILDEPSAGLSPEGTMVLYDLISQVCTNPLSATVLVEQNVRIALRIATRAIVLNEGCIIVDQKLLGNETDLAAAKHLIEDSMFSNKY